MRILLVNYRYFISGGPEKYMFNIKKILEEHGHEVVPFSVRSNKNVATEYEKYFVEPIGGRDATYYSEYQKTPRTIWKMLSRSVYSLEVKRAIQREIQETKPDLVYILQFVNKLSPSVIRGAKQMGLPVVVRLSDYFLLCPRFDFLCNRKICEDCLSRGYRSCVKKRCVKGSFFASMVRVLAMKIHTAMRIYDAVDAFITPSMFLKDKLVQSGFEERKIHCIPTFTTCSIRTDETEIGKYGLYFGCITDGKGVETVVKAYEILPERRVLIVGDDHTQEAKRLKQYVREHELKNIEFTGFKGGNDLERIIQEARFTIIPSICYDNLPNTALESFQYAKPVITSDLGSLKELVIDGQNGYLFEPGNAQDLAQKIRMLDDDQIVAAMGNANQKRLCDHFSQGGHYDMLMHVFMSMMIHLSDGENHEDH